MTQQKADKHSQYGEKHTVSGKPSEPQPCQQGNRYHEQQLNHTFAFREGHSHTGGFRFSFPVQYICRYSINQGLNGYHRKLFQEAYHVPAPVSPQIAGHVTDSVQICKYR